MKPLTIMTVNRSSKYNLSSTFIREMCPVFQGCDFCGFSSIVAASRKTY